MNKLCKAILVAVLLITSFSRAAIIYTDIPDGIPSGLDFNTDGSYEITISNNFLSGQGTYLTYSLPSNVYGVSSGQWDAAAALDFGFSIGATGNWFGFGDCTVTGNSHPTTFPLNADKYLGFKINIAGSVYYGWARVYVTAAGTGPLGTTYLVTYKDYAYESTPNTPITAGAGLLNVCTDTILSKAALYPNPTSGDLFVDNPNVPGAIYRYRLIDSCGRVLREGASVFGEKITASRLTSGLYFMMISYEGADTTKPFIKTN
ncbi:T9SS type A sorting domain-containing protein [Flavobacterium sp. TBRC 19031]|uniref:T9SS type A sorting domain-containing protein n=1 Tax=Flavobacterium mekongense TaxID=3379707 RepID=UPI00399A4F10